MGRKMKTSFTNMIIKGIFVLGISMLFFSLLFISFLQFIGRKGVFSSTVFVKMELLIAVGYILLMFVFIWGVSYLITRKIRRKGAIIIDISDKIRDKELDFEIEMTNITEIDAVLAAMQQMKDALANSLKVQWRMEQSKQKQLSALVHDLKTPITVLDGNLYLLKYENISDEGSKSIDDMIQCVKDMNDYVTQLMDVSKDNLQYNLNKEKCSLNELVDSVLQTMEILFKKKNISIRKEYEAEQIHVLCDQKEMKRAIQNILSNAVDFSVENSMIKIVITFRAKMIQVSVIDSGKGFSKQDLEKAKEQFYMGDSSRGRRNHFGLGLTITENIVNAHGGYIELSNRTDADGGGVSMMLPIL